MQQVQPEQEEGTPVSLNVYDVTNAASEGTNNTIVRINNVTRSLGVGGVFHGAVVIGNVELSFGFCERGTGVYSCPIGKNPMYTFRENIDLGTSPKSKAEIKEIIFQLRQQWPGISYDLLSRNCCHFCDEFCKQLGVMPTPPWLNRFAANADATIHFTNEAVTAVKGIGSELQRLSYESLGYLRASWQRTSAPAASHLSATSATAPLLPGDVPQLRLGSQQEHQQQHQMQQHHQQQHQAGDGGCSPRGGPGIGSLIASSSSRLVSSTKAFFNKVSQDVSCGPRAAMDVEYRHGEQSSLQSHLPGSRRPGGQASSAHSQQELPPHTAHGLLIPKQPKLPSDATATGGSLAEGDRMVLGPGSDLDGEGSDASGADPFDSQPRQQRSNLGIARSSAMVPGPAPASAGLLLGHEHL